MFNGTKGGENYFSILQLKSFYDHEQKKDNKIHSKNISLAHPILYSKENKLQKENEMV